MIQFFHKPPGFVVLASEGVASHRQRTRPGAAVGRKTGRGLLSRADQHSAPSADFRQPFRTPTPSTTSAGDQVEHVCHHFWVFHPFGIV